MFKLVAGDFVTVVVEDHTASARRPLVDCTDKISHGKSLSEAAGRDDPQLTGGSVRARSPGYGATLVEQASVHHELRRPVRDALLRRPRGRAISSLLRTVTRRRARDRFDWIAIHE
jgi:hypothetical protein